MKRILTVVFAAAIAVAAAGCSAQKNALTFNDVPTLKQAVESRDYEISVNQALPTSGRSVNLTSYYSLTVDGDKVKSHLPYFGRAYSVPYGGGEGLIFEGDMTGYTLKYGKKGEAEASFEVRTKEDTYQFRLTMFANGSASINVSPNNRQPINFSGELVDKKVAE